jgi:hypothetical protein
MDNEIYDLLMGDTPDSAEAARALAAALRFKKGSALVGAQAGGPAAYAKMASDQGTAEEKNVYGGLEKRMQYGQEKQAAAERMAHERDLAKAGLANTLAAQKAQADLDKERLRGEYGLLRTKAALEHKPGPRLSSGEVGNLTEAGAIADTAGKLATTFQPNFAGKGIWGSLPNTITQYMGSAASPKARESFNWWADYQKYLANVERHKMFGSAFTATEQRAWDAANRIRPGANPAEVKAALADLHEALLRHVTRHAKGRVAEGYNEKAINIITGGKAGTNGIEDDFEARLNAAMKGP